MTPEALQIIERYNRIVEELEDRAIARLDRALQQGYDDLEREFLRQYDTLQSQGTSLTARAQTAALMADLAPLLAIVDPAREEEFQQLFQDLITQAGQDGAVMADELLTALSGDEIRTFSSVPVEAVALEARDATRRLYRWNEDYRNRISGIVEQGLIQGWGPRRTAEQLQREVGILKGRAEAIARTESLSALNDAAQLRYGDAGVEGVQWVASIGEVCPYCVARNMRVYPVGRVRVPGHVNCRCVLLPWRPAWDNDPAFAAQYRGDRLADLQRQNQRPNYGPTPFERAAGITTAPATLWQPD